MATLKLPPVALALALCFLLFVLRMNHALDSWSANTGVPGYDFFGLPRCGIGLRDGVSLETAWKTIPYGPYSTDWASHPMLCLAFGLPLAKLQPWTAYWVFAGFLSLLQAISIVACPHYMQLNKNWKNFSVTEKTLCTIVYSCCGLFFPMYVLLHQAQYHGLSILWVLLVLVGGRGEFFGFVGSALSKPILAPAALIPLMEKKWGRVVAIVVSIAGVTGAFLLWERLRSGKSSLLSLGENGYLKLKYSVMNWNQEISFSKILERFFDGETNYLIRICLAGFCLVLAFLWMRVAKRLPEARVPALAACLLSIFFLYARGHEYHAVTFIPVLLALSARKEWLNGTLVAATILLALPTTWSLFASLRPPGQSFEINHMMATNAFLGWCFVLQKPLALGLLLTSLVRCLVADLVRASAGRRGGDVCES